MIFVRKIDAQGFFIEDDFVEEIAENTIETPCPSGFYKPQWNGTEWVEGGIALQPSVEQLIEQLKAELSATDYKIIKCSEYQLIGQALPYDIAALHTGRQALRDRINELELSLV